MGVVVVAVVMECRETLLYFLYLIIYGTGIWDERAVTLKKIQFVQNVENVAVNGKITGINENFGVNDLKKVIGKFA